MIESVSLFTSSPGLDWVLYVRYKDGKTGKSYLDYGQACYLAREINKKKLKIRAFNYGLGYVVDVESKRVERDLIKMLEDCGYRIREKKNA